MFHTEQVFAGAQLSPGLRPFSKELSGHQPKSGSFDKTSKSGTALLAPRVSLQHYRESPLQLKLPLAFPSAPALTCSHNLQNEAAFSLTFIYLNFLAGGSK
jgi:hypothetical protein